MHQSSLYLQLTLVEYIRGQLPHRICIVIQMQLSVSEYIKSNTLPPIHDDVHDLAFSYNSNTTTERTNQGTREHWIQIFETVILNCKPYKGHS